MSRYAELTAKVDAFFTRVTLRHGEDIQCGNGCSDCCHVRLTITAVEARALRDEIARMSRQERETLRANALAGAADRCAALDPTGRCLVYAARPIVCRSHGAPVRMRKGSLPVIESCFRNFTHTEPDPDCVIDQETLSALTLAVDREAGGDGSRVDLAELLRSA